MKDLTRVSLRWFAGLMLLISVAQAQTKLRFHLTDLNPAPGYRSAANAINNSGQVVGDVWYYTGTQKCFIWNVKGGQTVFYMGLRGVPDYCDAAGINQLGEVGGTYRTSLTGNPYRAFRRDTAGVIHGLTPVYDIDGYNGYAGGINDSGVVVGAMDTDIGLTAAMWTSDGQGADLGNCLFCTKDEVGHVEDFARGINAGGTVVGEQNFTSNSDFSSGSEGALSFFAGYLLPQLSTNTFAHQDRANAVNASGNIVGYSVTASGAVHAVLWTYGYVFDLGYGSVNSSANAISSDNWIVGSFSGTTAFVMGQGCYGMYNLNNLLDSSGAGWTLTNATGINDSHSIVGWGVAPNGQTHAFLLTPNKYPLC